MRALRKKEDPSILQLIMLAVLVVGCLGIIFLKANTFENIELADSDCYMRLIRVQQLHDTGDWYNNRIDRSNAPYGEILHWSRLLDVLLLYGAYAGSIFVPFPTALFGFGVIISPIFLIASIFSLFWASQAIFNRDTALRVCLLFVCQPMILHVYAFGRPDHHSLLLLLFIITLGFALRILVDFAPKKHAYSAGVLAAISMWVSVEALPATAVILGTLLVLWVWKREDYLYYAERFMLALTAVSAILLLLERPLSELAVMEYDKLSSVHLILFIVLWLTLRCITPWANKTRTQRIFGAFILPLALFAGLKILCPALMQSPFASVHPLVRALWLSKVQEVQGLLQLYGVSNWLRFSRVLSALGLLFWSLPYMFLPLINKAKLTTQWVFLNLGICLFVFLTLFQIRWGAYANVLLLFPTVYFLEWCLNKIRSVRSPLMQSAARVTVILVIAAGPFTISILLNHYLHANESNPYVPPMRKQLHAFLDSGEESQTILTGLDYGARLLYDTKHRVIATPYHRNNAGILFLYDTMSARTDEAAFELLQKRQVNLIVLERQHPEQYLIEEAKMSGTFYHRLMNGNCPPWLIPAALPGQLQDVYLIYEIKY